LGYVGSYKFASVAGDQNSSLELSGQALIGAEFQFKTQISPEKLILAEFLFFSQRWKPNLQFANSTQNELSILEVETSFRYASAASNWQYGLAAHQSFYAERDLQNIKNVNVWLFGPEVVKLFSPYFQAHLGYLIASKISEAKVSLRYNNYFSENKNYYYGVYLTVYEQSGNYGSGSQSQFQLAIGLSGF
jgi:hypothetical protein